MTRNLPISMQCAVAWPMIAAALLVYVPMTRAETVSEAKPLIRIDGLESPPPSSDGVQLLLSDILRTHIPHDYVNDKKWGSTKEIKRGLKIERDGLRITTKRRRKEVNHGTWKRYRVTLVDPEKRFRLRVKNYREHPNYRVSFDLVVEATLDVTGRISKWERGVQLFSLSGRADSDVELRVSCDVGLKLDASQFPPAVMLDPKVTDAHLLLKDFRLRELSNVRGPAAATLSSSVREMVEDAIEAKRDRMVEKMNAKIDRNRDKLRLSFREMIKTPWADKIQGAGAIP